MTEVTTRARHGRRRSASPARWIVPLLVALVLLAVGFAGGWMVAGARLRAEPATRTVSSSAAPSNVQPVGPPSHPTMMGDVTRVVTGDQVVVRVAGAETSVRILGLRTPIPMPLSPGGSAECGSREALEYADRRLTGQTVTLVPDPTQPDVDDQGRRLAYVVLHSQLSYTDAALIAGIGRADTSRPLWYADVFSREQRAAVDARRGVWGPPCRQHP